MNEALKPVQPRPSAGFMWRHPAHLLALGFGSGLSPKGPGTSGTLWAWAAFVALHPWLDESTWGWVIGIGIPLGVWACAVTARDMGVADPSAVVWDEVVAFWLVLWLVMPTGWQGQLGAFACFDFSILPNPARWVGLTACSMARTRPPHPGVGRVRAGPSCSTIWWPPPARCW